MKPLDYKKAEKTVYTQGTKPMILQVPAMKFIAIRGSGDPNEEGKDYQQAVSLLYGIQYTIKMSPRKNVFIKDYVDYVVPPLEGLWMMKGEVGMDYEHKENFEWISMIRLPEFVTPEVFSWAIDFYQEKHPFVDTSKAQYWHYEEGLCAQILHKGSFDDEPTTVRELHAFIEGQGYQIDCQSAFTIGTPVRVHHELYYSDPNKSKPENCKTLIRLPIRL